MLARLAPVDPLGVVTLADRTARNPPYALDPPIQRLENLCAWPACIWVHWGHLLTLLCGHLDLTNHVDFLRGPRRPGRLEINRGSFRRVLNSPSFQKPSAHPVLA